MGIYLSRVANRTKQVMEVLTVLGTIVLPAILISGFYGINTTDRPWADTDYATEIAAGLTVTGSVGLLVLLKQFSWFQGQMRVPMRST